MKQLLTLVILFAVLLGGYFFLRQASQPEDFRPPASLSLDNFAKDAFTEIVFSFHNKDDIKLEKVGNTWKVNGYGTDSDRMEQLLTGLDAAQVTSLVSTNSENHSRFRVDEKGGVEMRVSFNNADSENYMLGKSAGGESTYIRLPNEEAVYVMEGLGRYLLSEELTAWRDKKVAGFSGAEVRKVSFSGLGQAYELVLEEEQWVLQRNRLADLSLAADKVSSWLDGLAAINAVDFPSDEKLEDLANSSVLASVEVELGGVESFTGKRVWKVYSTEDDQQLLLVRDSDNLGFLISKGIYDVIFQPAADLIEQLKPEEVENNEA